MQPPSTTSPKATLEGYSLPECTGLDGIAAGGKISLEEPHPYVVQKRLSFMEDKLGSPSLHKSCTAWSEQMCTWNNSRAPIQKPVNLFNAPFQATKKLSVKLLELSLHYRNLCLHMMFYRAIKEVQSGRNCDFTLLSISKTYSCSPGNFSVTLTYSL